MQRTRLEEKKREVKREVIDQDELDRKEFLEDPE
jgi:hypothetical protein